MQHLEVSGAVRYIYVCVVRQLSVIKVKKLACKQKSLGVKKTVSRMSAFTDKLVWGYTLQS